MLCLQSKGLNSGVTSPNGLDWSEDFRLAMTTQKGLLIYTLVPDPGVLQMHLNLKMHLVPNDSLANPYIHQLGIDKQDLLRQLQPCEQHRVASLYYRFPVSENGKPPHRGTEIAKWTPKHAISFNDLALITLSEDCWLKVWCQVSPNSWTPQVDVSKLWHSYLVQHKWKPITQKNPSSTTSTLERGLRDLKSRLMAVCTSTFAWSPVIAFEGQYCSVLVTAQRSGHVVFWLSTAKDQSGPHKLEIISVLHSGLAEISFLGWFKIEEHKFFLFLGSVDGRVKVMTLDWKVKSKPTLTESGLVWDCSDRARVSFVQVIDHSIQGSTHSLRLILAKDSYLSGLDLKVNETRVKIHGQKSIPTGPSRIVNFVHLPSGIKLIFNEIGAPQHINLNRNLQSLSLSKYTMDLSHNHYKCNGAQLSPGGGILAVLQSINTYYDHLLIRTPGRISFLNRENWPVILERLLTNPDFELQPDSAEVLRLGMLGDEDLNIGQLRDKVHASKGHLKGKFWLLNFLANLAENHDLHDQLNLDVNRTATAILKLHATDLKQSDLNSNAQHFLQICSEEPNMSSDFDWLCRFCDSKVKSESWDQVTCQNDHSWPRCILSLGVADSEDLLMCPACDCVALPNVNMHYICSLCDQKMISCSSN
ncbi:general transcription factor 3C polypeptide 4-like [Tigriopus californicus]|uniref:general transcription factor 3C polypeptide 4-like n=1 Tax=Tigriopus californicus TaxID=6832 RepID=UPI0027DA5376|nr:general transcription factor 3C polypeptide 4-like [Tigriopus californicus]